MRDVTLNANAGGSEIDVHSTFLTAYTTINTGNGSDTVRVTPDENTPLHETCGGFFCAVRGR